MKNSYNRIAPYYQLLALLVYGKRLLQIQTSLLHHLPQKGCLLLLGGGDGRILPALFRLAPELQIVYLEASDRMISMAKGNAHPEQRIDYLHAAELPNGTFDAVLAPFFFDQFPDPALQLWHDQLVQRAAKDSVILISDFDRPRGLWQKCLLQWTILFFRWSADYPLKALPPVFKPWETEKHKLLETRHLSKKFLRSSCFQLR